MSRKLYTPHPYQGLITGHQMDVPKNAVWAGMGMGKTVSTLTTIANEIMAGEDHPTLVLAPRRVAKDVWPKESKKWNHLSGLEVIPAVGDAEERRRALSYDAPVHTINYENIPWLVEHWGKRWPYRRVVSDESTKIKSFRLRQGGVRAQALSKISHLTKNFTELTGTPSPNGLLDLWGQIWFLDGGERLGRTYTGYRDRWFRPDPNGYGMIPFEHSQEEIQNRLRDICLTLDPKDWFDLEEPIENNIYVELPANAARLYRDMEKKMFMELEGHPVEAVNGASKTQKLLQIANGAAYVDPLVESDDNPKSKDWKEIHDIKLQALDEVIEELGGNPLLVAYHFNSDLARLKKAFPSGKVLANDDEMDDFKTGRYAVGFGHPASMGHGVDGLQEHCHNVCFFAHWWNLEERLQFIERVGPVRQFQAGHKRAVTIHNIIAAGTMDEDVMLRNDGKATIQQILMDAMKKRGRR